MIKRIACMLFFLTLLALAVPASAESVRGPVVLRPLKDGICLVEGENRLVNDASEFPVSQMTEMVEACNRAIDALGDDRPRIYLYLVESSRSHSIARDFDPDSPAYVFLRENFHADAFSHLEYSTYEQFCEYFYQTDHHWNYKGSYQGYRDVVRLLLGEQEKMLIPVGVFICKQIFNGSYAKKVQMPVSEERFTFYRFDPFPVFEAYTSVKAMKSGKRTAYNHFSNYMKGEIKNDLYTNHYAQCYGADVGLLLFRGQGPEDRILLLIGNSLSNPLKTMLSAHYGTIVSVDLRYYRDKTGEDFSLSGVISQYDVDQVLFVGDAHLFSVKELPRP